MHTYNNASHAYPHTFHPPPPVPGQVTDLLVNVVSTMSLTVTWNPPTFHSGLITMYKVCVWVHEWVGLGVHVHVRANMSLCMYSLCVLAHILAYTSI